MGNFTVPILGDAALIHVNITAHQHGERGISCRVWRACKGSIDGLHWAQYLMIINNNNENLYTSLMKRAREQGYRWLRVVRGVYTWSTVYHQIWWSMTLCAINLYTSKVLQLSNTGTRLKCGFVSFTFTRSSDACRTKIVEYTQYLHGVLCLSQKTCHTISPRSNKRIWWCSGQHSGTSHNIDNKILMLMPWSVISTCLLCRCSWIMTLFETLAWA